MKEGKKKITLTGSVEDQKCMTELLELLNSIPGFHAGIFEQDMVIEWDETRYRRYARHNGGRRRRNAARAIELTGGHSMKELLKMQENAVYTCADVFKMMQSGQTAVQIAADMGLSRATYFRRLKLHREQKELQEESSVVF